MAFPHINAIPHTDLQSQARTQKSQFLIRARKDPQVFPGSTYAIPGKRSNYLIGLSVAQVSPPDLHAACIFMVGCQI
jgi:hypothetical protein